MKRETCILPLAGAQNTVGLISSSNQNPQRTTSLTTWP